MTGRRHHPSKLGNPGDAPQTAPVNCWSSVVGPAMATISSSPSLLAATAKFAISGTAITTPLASALNGKPSLLPQPSPYRRRGLARLPGWYVPPKCVHAARQRSCMPAVLPTRTQQKICVKGSKAHARLCARQSVSRRLFGCRLFPFAWQAAQCTGRRAKQALAADIDAGGPTSVSGRQAEDAGGRGARERDGERACLGIPADTGSSAGWVQDPGGERLATQARARPGHLPRAEIDVRPG